MTPEEKEVEQINLAYQDALIALGQACSRELLSEWSAVTLGNAASITKYTVAASAIIMMYRRRARHLSVAQTSLVRALLTGSGLADAEYPPSGSTLGALRSDFERVLAEWSIPRPLRAKKLSGEIGVDIENLPELEQRVAKRWEWAEIETKVRHDIAFSRKLDEKLKGIEEMGLEKIPQAERKLDLITGSKIVSHGERIAVNGAREHDADVVRFDRKAWGFVRVHDHTKSDHPCGFCSMLLTRGFVDGVIYNTSQSAGGDGTNDEHKYHTGCHCIAQKIYRSEQLKSPVYDGHRQLAREYEQLRDEYGTGIEFRHAWDKYIRSTKKVGPNKVLTAPESDSASQVEAA